MAPSTRTGDWTDRAACRGREQDMVPGDDAPLEIRLAKKICSGCEVTTRCYLAAEAIAAAEGEDEAQGVWGGLTALERAGMVGLGLLPRPCPQCDLDFVPINLRVTVCSSCAPTATILYEDYRPQIAEMIEDGRCYAEIAAKLRLRSRGVAGVCVRWKMPSKVSSPNIKRAP